MPDHKQHMRHCGQQYAKKQIIKGAGGVNAVLQAGMFFNMCAHWCIHTSGQSSVQHVQHSKKNDKVRRKKQNRSMLNVRAVF